jgi:hypothetical protein
LQYKLQSQRHVPKKAELESECPCFDEFPERSELAAKLQTEKLPGDLQEAEVMAGSQFREEFLLLQLKYDRLVGRQDRDNSFRNARNREDAAQRLQRFVHWVRADGLAKLVEI